MIHLVYCFNEECLRDRENQEWLFDREIAVRCGVPRDVVAAYVAVFFDARAHLLADDWIMRHVVGHAPYQGFRENDIRQFWALMASSCGPEFLTVLIDTLLAALRPGEQPVMSVYFRPTVPLPVQASVAVAVPGMSPDAIAIVEKSRHREVRAMRLAKPKKRRAEMVRAANDLVGTARRLLAGRPLSRRLEKQSGGSVMEEWIRRRPAAAMHDLLFEALRRTSPKLNELAMEVLIGLGEQMVHKLIVEAATCHHAGRAGRPDRQGERQKHSGASGPII